MCSWIEFFSFILICNWVETTANEFSCFSLSVLRLMMRMYLVTPGGRMTFLMMTWTVMTTGSAMSRPLKKIHAVRSSGSKQSRNAVSFNNLLSLMKMHRFEIYYQTNRFHWCSVRICLRLSWHQVYLFRTDWICHLLITHKGKLFCERMFEPFDNKTLSVKSMVF